jgi:osmotically-inducible protein OsmY
MVHARSNDMPPERIFMKSDLKLREDIVAELDWDPALNAHQIGVAVKDGVVTVSGHVDNYSQKWAVEKALNRVAGVRAVALELDVRLSPDHQRGDTEIAKAAEWALEWHSQVPVDVVRVTVDKGWITLQGEVEWGYQRDSAERAVRNLKGVIGVSSEITLKTKPMQHDLEQRIRDALTRQAVREANHLHVDVHGREVTLRGTVHSWREREAARGAAWSAPGVSLIVDEMTIE